MARFTFTIKMCGRPFAEVLDTGPAPECPSGRYKYAKIEAPAFEPVNDRNNNEGSQFGDCSGLFFAAPLFRNRVRTHATCDLLIR